MAIESFSLALKPEQNLDSAYAFGVGLMKRGIISGVNKTSGVVVLYMLPESAARYAKNDPSYADDRNAVKAALLAAGYSTEKPQPTPVVEPTPVTAAPPPPPPPPAKPTVAAAAKTA